MNTRGIPYNRGSRNCRGRRGRHESVGMMDAAHIKPLALCTDDPCRRPNKASIAPCRPCDPCFGQTRQVSLCVALQHKGTRTGHSCNTARTTAMPKARRSLNFDASTQAIISAALRKTAFERLLAKERKRSIQSIHEISRGNMPPCHMCQCKLFPNCSVRKDGVDCCDGCMDGAAGEHRLWDPVKKEFRE